MQVIIKEREYEYQSDYNNGWVFSSGDDFKFPVKIGGRYSCFVKRFARNPERVSGWQLLQALRATTQPGLPRIHDIVQTEEKGNKVRYLFYECMEGDTLDNLIREGGVPDTGRLTEDLFKALGSIHRHEHWMSDFCEKNIFCKKDGGFCLIDLDSAHPTAIRPDNEMYGNKEYWALVFSYLVNRVGWKAFRPGDIPGPLLNYLQVVFLIVRIRAALIDGIGNYKSTELCDQLPAILDSNVAAYAELVSGLAKSGSGMPDGDDLKRIKGLLVDTFVRGKPDYKIVDTAPVAGPGADQKLTDLQEADPVPVKQPLPVIGSFSCDKKRLKKGGPFTLSWEVKNEETVSVARNGLPYKIAPKGSGAMTLSEKYDGKEKKIVFTLTVSNKSGIINGQPVLLCVGPANRKPLILVASALPVLIVLILLLIRGIHQITPDPLPVPVKKIKDTVAQGPPMVVAGDAFRRMEDSLNADRQRKMRAAAQAAKDRVDSLARRRAAPGKGKTANTMVNTSPKADSAAAPVIDEAAIERERRRERLALVKRVQDSVSVIDTVFTGKLLVFRNDTRKLCIQNRSGFFLDTVVVEISPGGKGKPYRKEFFNIKAKSWTVIMDKLPKKQNLQASLVSIAF